MAITAAMVKDLREMTGAGMMDCKKALAETDGDMDKAVEFLREKGLAAAEKKAGRIAAEGVCAANISEDGKTAAIVEVNSETDFVAKNDTFKTFVANVVNQAIKTNATDIDAFLAEAWAQDTTKTVKEELSSLISIIGENMNIRRFQKVVAENGFVESYIHGGGRIGVLVEAECAVANDAAREAAKNIAMQIAAISPKYVQRTEIPEDYIAHEKEILKAQAMNENTGKPENIIEKMIEGRLNKELKEICLVDQVYVKDGDLTVQKYLDQVSKEIGTTITIKSFVRFETGEGIAKKEENFAEEVAKQMGL
ncbi:MAG: translation elongation factor Ts [Anaerocolumna sp.]|jgi:elongation factor Ts|nr:translation elongation factor Ts [Anaerocolumna sp.]